MSGGVWGILFWVGKGEQGWVGGALLWVSGGVGGIILSGWGEWRWLHCLIMPSRYRHNHDFEIIVFKYVNYK